MLSNALVVVGSAGLALSGPGHSEVRTNRFAGRSPTGATSSPYDFVTPEEPLVTRSAQPRSDSLPHAPSRLVPLPQLRARRPTRRARDGPPKPLPDLSVEPSPRRRHPR